MGGVQRQVQRAGMARAKEMSMLARRYDPATLERWGLINLVVPDETLEEAPRADRKRVVSGKSVSVRVDLGGRRNLKQKTRTDTSTQSTEILTVLKINIPARTV